MDELRLELLGAPRIIRGGLPVTGFISSKAQALLCYLALSSRPHTRATLASLLWGELPDDDARRNLRSALANLNKLVGPHLVITRETIAFNRAAPAWLDVAHFESGLPAADRALPDLGRLQAAIALYRGELLEGLHVRDAPAFEEWLTGERERLRQLAMGAMNALAAQAAERGDYTMGIDAATRLLALEPWEENAYRQLMQLLALSGRPDAALAQYERCRRVLMDELGVEPAVETTVLYEQIRAGAITPRAIVGRRQDNLPVQRLPLIGRADDIATVSAILLRPDVGVLTLLGPGGIGKTQLAIAVARDVRGAFPDGVWFVDLAPIRDPELVAAAIAQILGVAETAGQPLTTSLQIALRDKQLLLVLDNVEQVRDAAQLVADLLAAAAHLKVLITSRAALPLYGRHEFPVPPLALPTPAQSSPDRVSAWEREQLDDLAQTPAVALFMERARAVRPDFALTGANAASVAAICARLDGLPLAIELAAARIKLFTPQVLLAQLEQPYEVLRGGPQDRPERQRTLRATLSWSYDLLSHAEQMLFRGLAVFVGGWTLAAAEAVCLRGTIAGDVVSGVESLVHQNLVRVLLPSAEGAGAPDAEPRFTMLETIREYGLEQLKNSGEAAAIQQSHLDYFLEFAETAAPKLRGADLGMWLVRLEVEHDNLRAALRWAQERGQYVALLRLGGALSHFWLYRGHQREGQRWLEAGLATTTELGAVPTDVYARALLGAGLLTIRSGKYVHATTLLEAALAQFREVDDQQGMASALLELGNAAWFQTEYERAQQLLTQSLARSRAIGDTVLIIRAIGTLSQVAVGRGDLERALPLIEEGMALAREVGDSQRIALLLTSLAYCRLQQADLVGAEAAASEALARFQALGERWLVVYPFLGIAAVAARRGQARRAARLLGAAATLREQLGMPLLPALQSWYGALLTAIRDQLGEDASHVWAEGRVLPLEQAIAEALASETEALRRATEVA